MHFLFQLNGAQTLDENIADNGGLRIAFYAYKNYVEKNEKEKILQGFKKYSNEQMFFLAFANVIRNNCSYVLRKNSNNLNYVLISMYFSDMVRAWN